MRILHVITTIERGGAENQLLVLVREQMKQNLEVEIIYLKGENELENDFQSSEALWLCRLYIGEGRANSNSTTLNLRTTSECLKRLTERHPEAKEDLKKIESQYLRFIDEAELPDCAEWQKIYTSRVVHPRSPSAICNWISHSIDKSFPAKLYSSKKIYVQDLVPITKLSGIRVRLLLAAHFCNLLIDKSKCQKNSN